jgi:uncharacterized protein YbjT (DUF2867 family)
MHILVTGGTGTLGRTVVPKLAGAGHVVRVLTRNPSTEGHFRGDLETGTGITEAVAGTDTMCIWPPPRTSRTPGGST